MRIYNIISIAIFKSILLEKNLYYRYLLLSNIIIINREDKYIIKKFINKRYIRRDKSWSI